MQVVTDGYGTFDVLNSNDTHYKLQSISNRSERFECLKTLKDLPLWWQAKLVKD
jgi:hypothetical protein